MKEAEKLRKESNSGGTEFDKILAQSKRLIEKDCKSIFWYDPIPYADRKKLVKEGFTISDNEGHIQITW